MEKLYNDYKIVDVHGSERHIEMLRIEDLKSLNEENLRKVADYVFSLIYSRGFKDGEIYREEVLEDRKTENKIYNTEELELE